MVTEEQYNEFCDKAKRMQHCKDEAKQYYKMACAISDEDNKFRVELTCAGENMFYSNLEHFLSDKELAIIREWVVAYIDIKLGEADREFRQLQAELIEKKV
jgi:hypothetical protein